MAVVSVEVFSRLKKVTGDLLLGVSLCLGINPYNEHIRILQRVSLACRCVEGTVHNHRSQLRETGGNSAWLREEE